MSERREVDDVWLDRTRMTGSPLAVTVVDGDGAVQVQLAGELDRESAPSLESALQPLIRDGSGDLVLELSGLDFVDSSGIAALIAAHQQFDEQGRRAILRSPSHNVLRVLEICDLVRYLNVESAPPPA